MTQSGDFELNAVRTHQTRKQGILSFIPSQYFNDQLAFNII